MSTILLYKVFLSRVLTSINTVFGIGLDVAAILLQPGVYHKELLDRDLVSLSELGARVIVHVATCLACIAAVDLAGLGGPEDDLGDSLGFDDGARGEGRSSALCDLDPGGWLARIGRRDRS